jgi:hypothetical protein
VNPYPAAARRALTNLEWDSGACKPNCNSQEECIIYSYLLGTYVLVRKEFIRNTVKHTTL